MLLMCAGALSVPSEMAAEKLASANSPVLYGYNSTGGYYVSTTLPAGIYSFPAAGGDAVKVATGNQFVEEPQVVAYNAGKFYMVEIVSDWWTSTTQVFVNIYNADTWEQLNRVEVTGVVPQQDFCVNNDGTKAYATAMNGENFETYLNEIDLTTGESTKLFEISSMYYVGSCFNPEGKMLLWDTTNYNMQIVNVETGEIKSVNDCDIPDLGGRLSFTFDKHNNCIWVVGLYGDDSYIYSMDPTTGISTFSGVVPEQMTIYGAFAPEYDAGVPDAVSDVDFEYASAGSQQATLSFKMPNKTYGGYALTGTLTAVVNIDGTDKEISKEAGSVVSLNETLANGNHAISIVVKNSAGTSPERRFKTFTGLDVPSAVENLQFTIDEAGNSHVEWTAPSGSVNGGQVDKDAITYNVVRNPNNVTVATNLKATEFDEVLQNAFGHYCYTITPCVGELQGTPATTETVTWGENNVPPFVENFDDWNDFSRYTVLNPNEDKGGWYSGSGNVYAYADTDQRGDYWLFTPVITLDETMTYTTAFDMSASSWSNAFCELEVSICSEPTLESAKRILVPKIVTNDNNSQKYVTDFAVETSGTYYLAFHSTTEASGAQTYIDNITVTPNSNVKAAAGVNALTAIPSANGALTSTLSFNAPSTNYDGSALTSLSKVEISRYGDTEPLAALTDVTSGKAMSWTDENALDGRNIYAVTPYSGDIKGMTQHVSVTTGFDVPTAIPSITAKATADGKALLEWTAPSTAGVNGGYVDPQSLTYNIYRADDVNGYYKPCIKEGNEGTTFTDDTFVMPEGKTQQVVMYEISAVNSKGEGAKAQVMFTYGQALPTPVKESFANATYSNSGWETVGKTSLGEWALDNGETTIVKPQDNDNGMLRFSNKGVAEATATLWSPRVAVEGNELELSFMMWHGFEVEPEDLDLTVNLIADDEAPVKVAEIAYANGANGWQRHAVNLNTFKSADNVKFEFIARGADSSASIFMDNVKVIKKLDNDVEVSGIEVPAFVELGNNSATVNVSNIGKQPATFTAILFKNNEEVAREEIENLPADESRILRMDMNILMTEATNTITYRAEVFMDNDQNLENNKSLEASTFVKRNTMPVAEIEGDNTENVITLEWDKPEPMMAGAVKDGMEDYSAFALNNFGDWITVDVDGKQTDFSKYWNSLTNAREPMAWEVWDIAEVRNSGFFDGLASEEGFLPHSGDKALINFTAIEDSWFGSVPSANDDWLISPEVVSATDLSFWMKSLSSSNPETVELYVTTENIDPSAPDLTKFTLVDTYTLSGPAWRQVNTVLPTDAKRFAVRHCTQTQGYIMMLDDFEFTPLNGDLTPITPKGYNVYRNNELIGTTNTETYTDKPAEDGKYSYFVTTLWNEGESAASNVYTTEAKGVNSLEFVAATGVSVRGVKGAVIINAEKALDFTVSALDGSVIFQGNVNGSSRIEATPGVYVVSAGGRAAKVLVK